MAFKYIVLRAANQEIPVIFPGRFTHSWVADAIRVMMVAEAKDVAGVAMDTEAETKLFSSIKAVSAGEIVLPLTVYCGGRSETLGLESRGQVDSDLIMRFPYYHGIVPDGIVPDEEEG